MVGLRVSPEPRACQRATVATHATAPAPHTHAQHARCRWHARTLGADVLPDGSETGSDIQKTHTTLEREAAFRPSASAHLIERAPAAVAPRPTTPAPGMYAPLMTAYCYDYR